MSNETAGLNIAIWQFGLNALWVLLPLVPAVVIYLIFPKTQVSISGPLQGLTIRSSGAFAAYLIVFLATYHLLNVMNDNLGGMFRPSWTISGTVIVKDADGRIIQTDQDSPALNIRLSPPNISLDNRAFRAVIPEIDGEIPVIYISYPGYGEDSIDPNGSEAVHRLRVDYPRRRMELISPLVIQRARCGGPGCKDSASAASTPATH
jgi:hypothetical protein